MVYSPNPPYEVLQTKLIDFPTMQRLKRFARYWDLVANSGNFVETTPLIWENESPFWSFLRLSDWLYERVGRTHTIQLTRLFELLSRFLREQGRDKRQIAESLLQDYRRGGRTDRPAFLKEYAVAEDKPQTGVVPSLRRQARHLTRTG
jgi:hypothetical protein